jgi:head-tail adaptor
MKAGILRDRVRIEQALETLDANGGVVKTWTALRETPAQIMTLSGREFFMAATDAAGADCRIRMREQPGIVAMDPRLRLVDVDRGDVFDIVAVLPSRLRNDLTLAVKRGGRQP